MGSGIGYSGGNYKNEVPSLAAKKAAKALFKKLTLLIYPKDYFFIQYLIYNIYQSKLIFIIFGLRNIKKICHLLTYFSELFIYKF